MLAEGLIDGEVVATDKRAPARRPSKIVLWLDNEGVDLVADGFRPGNCGGGGCRCQR